MAYEKLGFVDNVTPLDAAHFNHMEEGIAKANSVVETVGGDTLTWDGNTDGLIYTEMDGQKMYRISDAVPTLADCVNGTHVVYSEGTEIDSPYTIIEEVTAAFGALMPYDGMIVAAYDNQKIDVSGGSGVYITFPKAGVYTGILNSDGVYIASLTIPGYTGFTKEIIKQDALPEALRFGETPTVFVSVENATFSGEIQPFEANAIPEIGETVHVEFDGTMFACKVLDFYGSVLIGDAAIIEGAFTEGAEPFVVVFASEEGSIVAMINVLDTTKTHSIKVSGNTIEKIQPKYVDAVAVFYVIDDDSGIGRLYKDASFSVMATKEDVEAVLGKKAIMVNWSMFKCFPTFVSVSTYAVMAINMTTTDSASTVSMAYTAEYTPETT